MMNKVIFIRFLIFTLLFFDFIVISITGKEKKSLDDQDFTGDTDDEGKEASIEIAEPETANTSCTRRQNSRMHEIRSATRRQFPFMASIMSQQNEYLCSGSVISHGLVLTTAKCSQEPINYVLVNATSDKKDDTTVSLHVIKTEKFPSYTGPESVKDVAIIYTAKHNKTIASKIKLSKATNSKGVLDLEAIGYGLNADVGKPKELQYVGVEVRVADGDKLVAFIDCIETKVLTCFKDSGGPVILDNQLFGIVTKGTPDCTKEMTSSYALNKRMIEILPVFTFKSWLDEKIRKNEEQETIALDVYPSQPVFRHTPHKMTSGGHHIFNYLYIWVIMLMGAIAASIHF